MGLKTVFVLFFGKLVDTRCADILLSELTNSGSTSAKMTYGNIFFENNLILVNVDFNRICVSNSEFFSKLLGYYNTAKLVYISYNSGRFQFVFRLCFKW